MNIELEMQIRNRISEVKVLLKNLSKDSSSRYRSILKDEIVRLKRELAAMTPLENDAYLENPYLKDAFDALDQEMITDFDLNQSGEGSDTDR